MPRSRNTRVRAKDTSRAEARRRHKVTVRAEDDEADVDSDVAAEAAAPQQSRFALPDVGADVRALPEIFRKPTVWLPFGILIVAFVLELARRNGQLPAGQVGDIAGLYIELTLPPTALFVFFIGGFVAPRGSYLVGGILGAFDALLITLLGAISPIATVDGAAVSDGVLEGQVVQLWGIAIAVGVLAGGFAAWYRRFLRSSQERAKANRAARDREQAAKAKEQARKDKADAREARRKGSD